MPQQNTIIYVRKSTESEDRQVLSIESQLNELKRYARNHGLKIVDIYQESKSAKAPGRPIFNKMMQALEKSNVSSILCWKLDRLARNPVDGGAIIWTLEENKIERIITPHRSFKKESGDSFMMQIEFGVAKMFVDQLKVNVERGMRTKCEKGWYPHLAPIGYLNDQVKKTIIIDPKRYPIVRKMWDLILTGNHTPPEILKIVTTKWGLRTRCHNKKGGNPLARSAIYEMFANPFYYGCFRVKGKIYKGKHKSMITKTEFDMVQRMISRNDSRRQQKHEFAFTGLIKCGECGASITAEHKKNRHGYHYVYYHCTKRKTGITCHQKCIEITELENQILRYLESITINKRLREWLLEVLQQQQTESKSSKESIVQSLKKQQDKCKHQLSSLLNLKIKEMISDEDFVRKREELETELFSLKDQIMNSDDNHKSVFKQCENTFDFAHRAQDIFVQGGDKEKRSVLNCLSSNLILKDKKLQILAHKPFEIIRNGLSGKSYEQSMFEPAEIGKPSQRNEACFSKNPEWSSTVDDVRKWYMNNRQDSSWFHLLSMLDYTKNYRCCKAGA